MPAPLLATKFFVPLPRPKAVPRPRLVKRLQEGLQGRLMLISAPAGFGKTTLVSEWLAGRERPAAWLSLDAGDSDPTRFLAYLVAALQKIVPGLAAELPGALNSPQPPPVESMLTVLLNEIAAVPDEIVLVLDDYHAVDSTVVDQALAYLLEHLPPRMRLLITSREDPQLPLARLRARGHLTELRAADLRFTPVEAAEFLNQVMDLHLSTQEVAALESRTEGWIAALQLAALSMRGRVDTEGFVTAFAGDDRYIVDYLVEEVLRRQPESVREFLLQTSILDRLSAALCDAVTGHSDSAALLDILERGNLFVVALDDKRRWFRYHHLFAAVLSAHARQEQPAHLPLLHQRASAWYAENGLPADAIRHALAARDFARAASLVESAAPAMRRSRQEVVLLNWLQALPDALIATRPVLSVYYAGVLLQTGTLEGVEARLRNAESWLDATADAQGQSGAPPEMVVVDQEEFRRLPGSIAIYRAGLALFVGDVPGTLRHARRALDLIPDDDHLGFGAASTLSGLAYWTRGDLGIAHEMYVVGMEALLRAGFISDTIGCAIAAADIQIAQGRLGDAMATFERGLALATERGAPVLRGAADMYVGMADLQREHGDLNAAEESLRRSQELGEYSGLQQNPYRWRVAMARIRQIKGDLEGALDLLREAGSLYEGDFSPNVRPIAAFKARVWIALGRLDAALGWVRARGLSPSDELSYLREFEHITLARVLLASAHGDPAGHSLLEAQGLLERLRDAAEAGQRVGRLIEILVVQALAFHAQRDVNAALEPLQRALRLGEAEAYSRIFVDEGRAMAHLLREAAARGILPDYAGRLLAAIESELRTSARGAQPPAAAAARPLVEPLSERELEVLRLFQTDLSGPEIARELVIALSTLRTHTKAIYGKLNVNSRRAAVNRSHELHLI